MGKDSSNARNVFPMLDRESARLDKTRKNADGKPQKERDGDRGGKREGEKEGESVNGLAGWLS